MNKFLSKFVAIALLSGVTVTAVNAANEAVWSGTTNGTTLTGGEVAGADVNVTVTLHADMNPGTTFDFHVVDGSIANSGSYLLCNGSTAVGKYVNLVTANAAGRATVIGLEFSTDANTTLTKSGEVLNLIDSSDSATATCVANSNKLNIVPDIGKCVSVFSDNGLNNNGSRKVTEINSAEAHILDYQADIEVACDTPICLIANSKTAFTSTATAMGVNKRIVSTVVADTNATDLSCYTVGCTSTIDQASCTTYVTIKNNTDTNITAVDLALTGTIPAGMIATFKSLENNSTDQNVTLNGSAIHITDLMIAEDENASIEVTFVPNGTDTILETTVGGSIKIVADTNSSLTNAVYNTKGIAEFSEGATTDFTVTYMNPSFKTFAMITAKSDSKLSATITDSTGKTAEATFPTLKAGETTFVWADKAGHATSPLQVAADAEGLNNAWTVTFHVTAAVDVAAYMEANGGQRTLTVLYPEYTATGQ
jgi:hypothetical protein